MRTLLPLVLAVCAGCAVPDTGPGDEVMGNFTITAEELPRGADEPFARCDAPFTFDGGVGVLADGGTLKEFDGGTFEFTARMSRSRDAGDAFVVIGGIARGARFDGQVVEADFTAPRRYTNCGCLETDLTETLTVALLSTSQNAATGNECPGHPLDGGLPAPTPDGGIVRPDSTPRGFDAVRACGELTDVVRPRPGSNCQCAECWMRYQVRGVRR